MRLDIKINLKCVIFSENYWIKQFLFAGGVETTTAPPLEMCPEIPDTYTNSCPELCPPDFACDGTSCVPNTDCPCFRNGKRFEVSLAIQKSISLYGNYFQSKFLRENAEFFATILI